jgi:hypothetical protein
MTEDTLLPPPPSNKRIIKRSIPEQKKEKVKKTTLFAEPRDRIPQFPLLGVKTRLGHSPSIEQSKRDGFITMI